MTREQKQGFTLRITQANPTQMIVILYEMTLCYVRDAEAALERGQRAELRDAVRKARGCISELMRSLNLKYQPAPALLGVYGFCIRRLAAAEAGETMQALLEIEKVILPLHDAYEQIADRNSAGAVMNNSQTVYAGLTYGRNSLTENMADQGANRGIYA